MNASLSLVALFTGLIVLCGSAAPAYAYMDPGTGSMILQAIVAGVAAVGVVIGAFWSRLKAFFGRGERKRGPR